jgi:ribosomal-protein-alanine N-acetyltransferase
MTTADLPAVLALERALFGVEAWTRGMFTGELAQTSTRYYLVAEDDAGLLGYAGLCVYPDEAFIQTLAVRRDRWGRGLGSRLLAALLAEADARGAPVVGLEVHADHDRAQQLYQRFGFAPVSVRRGYYQPSGGDALVMQRRPR